MCTSILQSVCFAALLQTCMAWLPAFSPSHSINRANLRRNVRPTSHLAVSRRGYFAEATLLSSAIVASFNVPSISSDLVAHASTPLADGNVFADKHFSVEDAKQRFQAARKDLRYLVENYSDISKGGGDAVRNYLGTQGVNSNLYGIQRVLKILRDEASDIVEYTEAILIRRAFFRQRHSGVLSQNCQARSRPNGEIHGSCSRTAWQLNGSPNFPYMYHYCSDLEE
jgi:hypothetical protein